MPAAIGITTNLPSVRAQRSLSHISRDMETAVQRLSSGLRINSAKDDAAGIAIATGMEATLRSNSMAQRNANDAVAMLQTAEGAYETLSDILIRMRELAIQAGNDTLTATDRVYLDTEFGQLRDELDRIAAVTEYNGISLLDGTAGDGAGLVVFQVGKENTADNRIQVKLESVSAANLKVDATKITSLNDAQATLDSVDGALETIATNRAALGASMNQLTWSMDNLGVAIENVAQAQSQIRDTDIAAESSNFASAQVLQQAGVSMLAQANGLPQLALQLLG